VWGLAHKQLEFVSSKFVKINHRKSIIIPSTSTSPPFSWSSSQICIVSTALSVPRAEIHQKAGVDADRTGPLAGCTAPPASRTACRRSTARRNEDATARRCSFLLARSGHQQDAALEEGTAAVPWIVDGLRPGRWAKGSAGVVARLPVARVRERRRVEEKDALGRAAGEEGRVASPPMRTRNPRADEKTPRLHSTCSLPPSLCFSGRHV
jgi:hypothetical protein